MTIALYAVWAASSFALLYYLFAVWMSYEARRDLEEFEKRFPDRCAICAFHRYGIMHGHVGADELCPEHDGCPERSVTP